MKYLLPASVYQPPPRLGRGRHLNTIIEDHEEITVGSSSDSEGTGSDSTVVGRPTAMEQKYSAVQAHTRPYSNYPSSPQSVVSSPSGDESERTSSTRNSYTGSDNGTVFSDSCPSLTGSNASETTTFATDSSRNSIASRSSRNRYPALLIPRGSWNSVEGEIKHVSFGMSPSTKIMLSPETLKTLSRSVPELDAPPSLGDSSSVRSESPCLPATSSLPPTPDMHNLEVSTGQPWGGHDLPLDTPLEIALDDHHSILLSPAEAHSSIHTSFAQASTEWNNIMGNFPPIPGATPQELTPITPNIPKFESFKYVPSDHGVELPAVALEVLKNLTRIPSPSFRSEDSASIKGEMVEQPVPRSRPRSLEGQTPLSDYSYSQLSIPSPGGFFSSLKMSARHTWCSPRNRGPSPPPSSATAENFYNTPWTRSRSEQIVETVLELPDSDTTDGPPTVKQALFDLGISTPRETSDLYGGGDSDQENTPSRKVSTSSTQQYEKAYEEGIKQAAEANLDRTGHWLSAQTTYLAALRETNPLNDPADFPATTNIDSDDDHLRKQSMDSETLKVVRFLQEANKASPEISTSPTSASKENLFLEAFEFLRSGSKRRDTFVHASARLKSIQAARIALPNHHVKTLLNSHDSSSLDAQHPRPKYRGPFSQNPRQTGVFQRTAEQDRFSTLERQQNALAAILPSVWAVEAQRKVLYNGRLLACRTASERLSKKSASLQNGAKKSLRILDLGGASTASWAWAAAGKWSNAKVYTVQSRQQIDLCVSPSTKKQSGFTERPNKPANPSNHRVIAVPSLWQLPFKAGYFDVISARTLHMYLRSLPVPSATSIDEWDMTLKECMRVLKPGGILDFFVMDSELGNSTASTEPDARMVNLSPNAMTAPNAFDYSGIEDAHNLKKRAEKVSAEFRAELRHRGYEQDGGCGRLMARLKQEGFVGVKRQWIALPMGLPADGIIKPTHSRNESLDSAPFKASNCITPSAFKFNQREPAYASHFNADGTIRTKPFRLAPRPISEVSSVSKIVDQYLNVEAVQGPVGSTNDVADMSALLGELLWEEWLVRLRVEAGWSLENALEGVGEVLEECRRSGKAAWRGVVGWARKPTRAESEKAEARERERMIPNHFVEDVNIGFVFDSERAALPLILDTSVASWQHRRNEVPYSYHQQQQHYDTSGLDRNMSNASLRTMEFSLSAIERGDVGEIPMLILR